MNRKAGISIFTICVLILVVVVLAMAQNKVDNSTINKTIETLNWTKIGNSSLVSLQRAADNSQNSIVGVILNIAYKAIDFFGYAIFEVSKLAMQLARDNPNIINYKVLIALILLSLIAPLIYPIFVVVVSIILIIKEWYQKRKETRALNKCKEVRQK